MFVGPSEFLMLHDTPCSQVNALFFRDGACIPFTFFPGDTYGAQWSVLTFIPQNCAATLLGRHFSHGQALQPIDPRKSLKARRRRQLQAVQIPVGEMPLHYSCQHHVTGNGPEFLLPSGSKSLPGRMAAYDCWKSFSQQVYVA